MYMHYDRGGNKHPTNESQEICQCDKCQSYHIPYSHAIKDFDRIGYQAWDHIEQEYSVDNYKNAYFKKIQSTRRWDILAFKSLYYDNQ